MRTTPLFPFLLAAVAVSGCAQEDATLPLAPLELTGSASDVLAADSVTAEDDDDLVCEWGPVEGQEGEWEVNCYRDEDTGEVAGNAVWGFPPIPNVCLDDRPGLAARAGQTGESTFPDWSRNRFAV